MICLGIESTAHTFGIGIIDSRGNVLANEKACFTTKEGGINPTEAKKHHIEKKEEILERALQNVKQIDLISVASGPGLAPCLGVGMGLAKRIARENDLPLIGINHCVAHIEIGKLKTKACDPIVVYSSGANTQIIGFENGAYRVYGETLDIGIGNALDNFARSLGVGFPGGPFLDKMYFEGKNYIELPYTVKGMDLAFSGLLTAAQKKVGIENKEDLAYSFVHNAFAMLTEITERALAHTEKKEVLVVGGVAASKALNEMLGIMCAERKAKKFVPEMQFCVDNGLMIAWQGLLEYSHGRRQKIDELDFNPKWRADQVDVNWIR